MLDKIILIHPTKCAGTAISERLFKLKGFSDSNSAFYSGYSFNRFFQNNMRFFYFIFHSKNLVVYFIYFLFYCICFYFSVRNLFSKNKYGLTYTKGSVQHFTYTQCEETNRIQKDSICVSVVTHPQRRMVSSFYFLGYDKHYNFLEFLKKIQDGSLLSKIQFIGFRAIIGQHLIPMCDYFEDTNSDNKMDFTFKRESLDNDWEEFCTKYRLEYDSLKHINKTTSIKDWKDVYRIYPEAAQLVYGLYKKDFEHFGYTVIII